MKKEKGHKRKETVGGAFTVASLISGILLSVVFGAANAYLGLRAGMTVSASIPAAVIAMSVMRIFLKRSSVVESNMVQTIGSAGESLAAGAVFTIPALFLWSAQGTIEKPGIIEIAVISLLGGLLGVFFMIPLRRALIVKEDSVLPYPEGRACAKVLSAGDDGGGAGLVIGGMSVSAALKLAIDGLRAVPGEVSLRIKGYAGEIGTQIYPAIVSVGYICGARISSYMLSGGLFSWLVLIPLIVTFGEGSVLYPATVSISKLYSEGGASAVWSTYIRYIGAGALAAGGVISLIRSLPLIASTLKDVFKNLFTKEGEAEATDRDISIKAVILCVSVIFLLIWLLPTVRVGLLGAVIIALLASLFSAVSARMVGLVGSSNNPVSGMAIAALLITTVILKACGVIGNEGMAMAIVIGSFVCISATVSSDASQDLKTGYLVGASPRKQQIGEIIGVLVSALAIGGVMYLLDSAWGFGSEELAAPQATLMKLIAEGVMQGDLPWGLVFAGVFITVCVQLLGIPSLPFAIGIYLPVHLSACIMVGGVIRWAFERMRRSEEDKKRSIDNGLLVCSGMIAGEGVMGVVLALLAITGADNLIDISSYTAHGSVVSDISSLAVLALTVFTICRLSLRKNKSTKA